MYICTIFKYTIMEHRIKELIKEKGYTQQEFADLLGMSRVGPCPNSEWKALISNP